MLFLFVVSSRFPFLNSFLFSVLTHVYLFCIFLTGPFFPVPLHFAVFAHVFKSIFLLFFDQIPFCCCKQIHFFLSSNHLERG